jgi:hypothetical protein
MHSQNERERERRIPPSKEHNRLSILIITSHRLIEISLITLWRSARLYSLGVLMMLVGTAGAELNSSGRSRRAIMANYRKRQLIVRLAALGLLEKVNTHCIRATGHADAIYYYFYIFFLCCPCAPASESCNQGKVRCSAIYSFFQRTAAAFNAFVCFFARAQSDQGKRYK